MRTAFFIIALAALARGAVIDEWGTVASEYILATRISVNFGTRLRAMIHMAQFQAINDYTKDKGANVDPNELNAVAASAGKTVFAAIANNTAAELLFGKQVTNPDDFKAAIDAGATSANAVLASRKDDGSEAALEGGPWGGMLEVGQWRPNPPAYRAADGPTSHWGKVKSWLTNDITEFRAPPPPALNSDVFRASYDEVMAKGGINSTVRTPEETETAKFWDHGWIGILWAQVAEQVSQNMSVADAARLYAATFTALADVRTASMESQFYYNLWRPQTAIPQGNAQGWPADIAWGSYVETPNIPEYPSDNSAAGHAIATVLAKGTGSDNAVFTIETYFDMTIRTYDSFSKAAHEEGEGRMLGGEHFRFSIEAGADLGRRVANKAISIFYPGTKNLRA